MSPSLCLRFLVALAALTSPHFGRSAIQATVGDGDLAVQAPGLSLRGARPQVTLLVGAEERRLVWQPTQPAARSVAARSTPLGAATEETLTWKHPEGFVLNWAVTKLAEHPGVALRCTLQNGSGQSVRVVDFLLAKTEAGGLRCEGRPEDWVLTSLGGRRRDGFSLAAKMHSEAALARSGAVDHGRLYSSLLDPRGEDPAWRRGWDDARLYSNAGQTGVVVAGVGTESDVMVDFRVDGCSLNLEILSDMNEVVVDPGETRPSDEVLCLFEPWEAALTHKNLWIAATCGSRTKAGPVFGWCSWYRDHAASESKVASMVEFLKTIPGRLPFATLQIDDEWQIGHHDWRANHRYPGGMAVTADRIRGVNAWPGIWMCPIRCDSKREVNGKVVDYEMHKGKVIRVFPPEWYDGFIAGNPGVGHLDPTHPGVQAYIRREIGRQVEAGYTYFKFDFTTVTRETDRRHNPKKTRFQAQRDLFKLYREIIGDANYLLACGVVTMRQVAGYADAMRVGTDTGAFGGFGRRPLAIDGNPKNSHGFWFPLRSLMASCLDTETVIATDPDVTYAAHAKSCTNAQLRTWHSLLGLAGGALLNSEPFWEKKFQTPGVVRMFEIMHPISREKGRPFAGGTDPSGKEFGFVAKRPFGDFVAMAIWNPEHMRAADLGIAHVPSAAGGPRFHAWSFWDESYLGEVDRQFVAKAIAPYEGRVLRLTPVAATEVPVLIGSNLHITMGGAEIKDVRAGAEGIAVELQPGAGAVEGKLFFFSRQPLQVAESRGCRAVAATVGENVYAAIVSERDGKVPQSVVLRPAAVAPPGLAALRADPASAALLRSSGFAYPVSTFGDPQEALP